MINIFILSCSPSFSVSEQSWAIGPRVVRVTSSRHIVSVDVRVKSRVRNYMQIQNVVMKILKYYIHIHVSVHKIGQLLYTEWAIYILKYIFLFIG